VNLLKWVLGFLKKNPKKDKCVLCGRETPYTRETSIDERYGYIEGSGQLCEQCYNSH
jgi:hypothetical protein